MPPTALQWLTGGRERSVLSLEGTALPRALMAADHRVVAIDRDVEVVRALSTHMLAVTAQAESLPFDPCLFDVVICHQVFHRYAPGLVLSEMARVLAPGGHAAVSYLVRDDSVPWVRRLIALVRQLDPDAMKGDFGADSVGELEDSKYFPVVEHKEFRHWQPIERDQLLAMVAGLDAVKGLDSAERSQLLDEVRALHDEYAPGAAGLSLPFQLKCWRAFVDHQELTAPIEVDDGGLVIPL